MRPALLHCHSEFSARDSLIRADELPLLAAEAGYSAVALTDHGGVEGSVRFLRAARRVGVKPILGCELYVSLPGVEKARHLTVLARGLEGFSAICSLLTEAHAGDGATRRPAIPLASAFERLRDVVVLTGCASSVFWTAEGAPWLPRFAERFPGAVFLEVQPLEDWPEQATLNAAAAQLSVRYLLPLAATGDCHFPRAEDSRFHEALLAVGSGARVGDPGAWRFSTRLNYVMPPSEIADRLTRTGLSAAQAAAAVANTRCASDMCAEWSLETAPRVMPCPGDLPGLARAELSRRGLDARQEYAARLAHELAVLEGAGLAPYLLLVRECVELFRREGALVGPRGSVGGSLVAWLLGIATLDPLAHGLIFERFYAPGRAGLPDVDLDLPHDFRSRVPDILRARFGADRVAQLSTYSTFGARMAVRDAARAFAADLSAAADAPWEEESDAEKVDDLAAGRLLRERNPEAAAFADALVGKVRQFGAHPGGFVIADSPLGEGRSAIVRRGKDRALCWDLADADALGFVKFDFLGNRALAALRDAGVREWESVPLDAAPVYADLAEGRSAGVPQFHSPGMRPFLGMLRPGKFADLVWANAAYRPGGLGQMGPREMADAYRRDPDSLIVYQEDVMALCVGLAGFSWAQADEVRRVVAKSKGAEAMRGWADRFVAGCVARGTLTEDDARAFWRTLEGFSRYAFNRAHSTSYSFVSYLVAWAKRARPAETFAALLNHSEDAEAVLDEAPDFGVRVLAPDVNASGLVWHVEDGALRPPLDRLPGATSRIAKLLARHREKGGAFKDGADFAKRLKGLKSLPHEVVEAAFSGTSPLSIVRPVAAPPPGAASLLLKIRECEACELRAGCRAPVPILLGATNAVVVGEAPGRAEDRRGKPFVGESGRMLHSLLAEAKVDPDALCWTNYVHCWPGGPLPEGGPPACPWLGEELEALDPPLVLAVGRVAWQHLGGKEGIRKANATVIGGRRKVVACVHPAAALRDPALLPEVERGVRKFARLFREAGEK